MLSEEAKARKAQRAKELYKLNKDKYRRSQLRWIANNLDRVRDTGLRSAKRRQKERKEEIYKYLGDKCAKCGFSDKRALQFDHVNGGGTQDVLKFKSKWAYLRHILEEAINNTGKFQVLCANCNAIKRIENNEHRCRKTYSRNLPKQVMPSV